MTALHHIRVISIIDCFDYIFSEYSQQEYRDACTYHPFTIIKDIRVRKERYCICFRLLSLHFHSIPSGSNKMDAQVSLTSYEQTEELKRKLYCICYNLFLLHFLSIPSGSNKMDAQVSIMSYEQT